MHLFCNHVCDVKNTNRRDSPLSFDNVDEQVTIQELEFRENTLYHAEGIPIKDNTSVTEKFSQFCLKLNKKHILPFMTFTSIVNDVVNLFNNFLSMPVITEIQEVWKKLKTKQGYADYCKSLGMVSATTIKVDDDCYQFVSVTENITTLFSNKNVFEQFYVNSFCSDLRVKEKI